MSRVYHPDMSEDDVEMAELLDKGEDAWFDEWCPWSSFLSRSDANDYAVTNYPVRDARFVYESGEEMWRLYLERP